MSERIVKPEFKPAEDGTLLTVTPESAGWEYVGFQVVQLEENQTWGRESEDQELCIVLLSGLANVSTQKNTWENIGRRMSVFEKIPPYSVYVPSSDQVQITALTKLEIAICAAPGEGSYPARLIAPEDVGVETRGYGNLERQIHNILPEQKEADSLLVVEVFTPDGHWSSYPPHKHDRDALPDESLLEETYYFRVEPQQGFAIQRIYTDDRSVDETLAVNNGEVVLVPCGYHPVGAPPGYEVYYLNVMAGPTRTWKFHNDPDHDWLMNKR
ncbi:5-deoxy-glucuronate isomerase [Paenibacillus xylanexedens]|uniref:5-deoxy-glucuronate isomerase n=1 Tax=Paenibacillus xylanexedens TaxID=528191 RepID=UPI0011A5640D|nr:5-deoxy-glucuronate isomerase [Paenibacillus xylanexedens]